MVLFKKSAFGINFGLGEVLELKMPSRRGGGGVGALPLPALGLMTFREKKNTLLRDLELL